MQGLDTEGTISTCIPNTVHADDTTTGEEFDCRDREKEVQCLDL